MEWHARQVEEVAAELGVDPARGLTAGEAAARLERFGPNVLGRQEARSAGSIFLDQLRDLLVWVLIGAALISGLLLGDLVDAAVIVVIVVVNATIGFVQESRAEEALARFREMSAPDATVIRDGGPRNLPAAEVVPGDVLVLDPGERVAADARLAVAVHLEIDESTLTGESLPVGKRVHPVAAEAATGDRHSMVHAGTTVTAGRGEAIVVATGAETRMGEIARMLEDVEPPTPLQVELDRIGRRIALFAGVAAVVVFGLGLLRQSEVERLLLTAVALAVAAIPEGLPAVTTITLARGVRAMAERNAVIRHLPAVEALGAATVICTDKTGTLTRNEMRLQAVVDGGVGPDGAADPQALGWAQIAVLCSDVVRTDGGWRGDPTEVAIVAAVVPSVVDLEQERARAPRVGEIPFDSERKRMTTLHRRDGAALLATKGAPEVVLDLCSHRQTPDGIVPLDGAARTSLEAEAAELAARGLRTLALAWRPLDEVPADPSSVEEGLVLAALVGMSDEVRSEAAAAVAKARRAGVTVVMVTGDHEVTARSVADQIGLLGGREVMGGRELRRLGAEGLAPRVGDVGVYARVDPADKVTIVSAWQSRGALVAMTGDGVNDAPALRMADIGVAMGSGTDVAKEASDMVLADDNFATIVAAVERGREIFANLKKVVYFLLAANISEIAVMLIGFVLFGGFGEPLLAAQLLWINLVTDGLPALALGVDPPPPGLMERPPDTDRNILGVWHQLRLVWQAVAIALGPLAIYAYGAVVQGRPWEEVRTMAFTAVVVGQLLFAFLVRGQTTSVWRSHPFGNRWLVGAVAVSMALQLLVVYTPVGAALFATVPIPLRNWPAVLLAGLVPFLLIDAVKTLIRRLRPDLPTAYD